MAYFFYANLSLYIKQKGEKNEKELEKELMVFGVVETYPGQRCFHLGGCDSGDGCGSGHGA